MKIKEIRKYSGLTQDAFSKKYNIPKRTLEGWESGKRNPPEYVLMLLERVVQEDSEGEKNNMKKYEIMKNSAEFNWKHRKEITTGCTMDDVEPEKIGEFEELEEAEEELKKHKTEISESGGLFSVTEYMIQENEYDEDGEWISGGDVWAFSKMEICVVDRETRNLIAVTANYEEAEETVLRYEGEAGADIIFRI
ncbi:helix-turn-helix domain-containing protein [Roseburia hominis]|jgi:transcriptional regulator with XRE-family HTH domain|nr:MAG TPA: putative transcriptional regulator [Caudoviricetes sp.]